MSVDGRLDDGAEGAGGPAGPDGADGADSADSADGADGAAPAGAAAGSGAAAAAPAAAGLLNGGPDRSVTRSLQVRVPATAEAPAHAREFAALVCRLWAEPQLEHAATLVISELATNAVVHAGTTLAVRAEWSPDGLTLSVDDEAGGAPRVVAPQERVTRGRGLAIVENLAEAWGVSEWAGGKTVWARLGAEAAARARAAGSAV